MIWLNLQTATLRSPEYVSSEPTQRATWLNLICYCAEQENGGVIVGSENWKDRQWQQTCGVTLEEVNESCSLWTKRQEGILVAHYPTEMEAATKARRAGGAKGGRQSRRPKNKPTYKPTDKPTDKPPCDRLTGGLEHKVKKDKGREDNITYMKEAVCLPTLEEVVEAARKCSLPPELAAAWFHKHEARPITPDGQWTDHKGQPLANWRSALASYAAYRANADAERHRGDDNKRKGDDATPWNLKQRLEAITKQIDKVKSDPRNKVYDGWESKLTNEAAAKIKKLKMSRENLSAQLAK